MNDRIPTLCEWAGGEDRIHALFDDFYSRVVPHNDILAPVFAHMSAQHMDIVARFVIEVLGGSRTYSEGLGKSHATMVAKHIGRNLSEIQRQTWIRELLQCADENNLPDDPEFRSALIGYLEWGSRIAKINSQLTENPIGNGEPMPKWGWGETGGPYRAKDE